MVSAPMVIGGRVKFSSGYTSPPPISIPLRVATGFGARPKIRSRSSPIARLS